MIPIKLIPIDKPSSNPELNSLNGVISLPQKNVYTKYNTFPNIIISIPVFPLFINAPHFQITISNLLFFYFLNTKIAFAVPVIDIVTSS